MEAKKVFQGINVLDLATAAVGPLTSRYLTVFGATTVRVESRRRYDTMRTTHPFKNHFTHPDYCTHTELNNTGKRAITLDLTHPKGKEVAWRLVDWCNVIVESFTPGVTAKMGLDYESVRELKPDIVYASTNAHGQRGPHAGWRGYGHLLSATAGLYHFIGWPDREPGGHYTAYNDFIAARLASLALVAAVAHWRKTGEGQHIDLSQLESGVFLLAPMLMDYTANGRVQTRNGNRVPHAAPHGAYRCLGEERWITIAVGNDLQWEAFKKVIGEPEWTKDTRFASFLGRKKHEDELERLVGEWTGGQVAEDVMERMQRAGVPAGLVSTPKDMLDDPQLKARQHFRVVEGHPNIGRMSIYGPQPHMSKTPPEVGRFFGPMGYDNEYVYKEILGMSDDEISDCIAAGAFD